MKRFGILFLTLLFAVALVSCHHAHVYDPITQMCNCGEINPDVCAYVGDSMETATARFVSLQDAVDYVAQNGGPQTIHLSKDTATDGLTIDSLDVAIDFESYKCTFTNGSGIVVKGASSDVSITGYKKLEAPITVQAGRLETKVDYEGDVYVSGTATMKISDGVSTLPDSIPIPCRT